MFRQFFAVREAASPAAKPEGLATRRSRRSRPGLEDLEGRQLMSISLVHSPNLNVATVDTVRNAGSGTTSGGGDYLRFKFGTTFSVPTVDTVRNAGSGTTSEGIADLRFKFGTTF